MSLSEELERIGVAAAAFAGPEEELAGVIPAEPDEGRRVYLCAFDGGSRSWLALDEAGRPVADRALLRAAVSIAAWCEVAEESAGGGKLGELRAELETLRLTEVPEGIEEAEEAALALERVIGGAPRLATPAYLDDVGAATRRLELALAEAPGSPFAEAMKAATPIVDELAREVEAAYKSELR